MKILRLLLELFLMLWMVVLGFPKNLLPFDLCKENKVNQFQYTSGIYNQHGDKPPFIVAFRGVPKSQTF